MRTSERFIAVAAVALLALLAGCSNEASAPAGDASSPAVTGASGATGATSARPVPSSSSAPSTVPASDPTVRGVLALETTSTPLRLTKPSDPYYDRMAVVVDDGVVVTSATGQPVAPATLASGMTVDLWITGGCRESYPVSCDLAAVQVVGP